MRVTRRRLPGVAGRGARHGLTTSIRRSSGDRARRRSPRCAPPCRTATPSCPGSRRSNCPPDGARRKCGGAVRSRPRKPTDRACEQPGDLGAERAGEIGARASRKSRPGSPAGSPFCVDRVDAAPSVSLVEHVVVVQRSEVHELAGHAAEHDVVVGRRASDAATTATIGRNRLPPATTKCEAISVRYGSDAATAAWIARSMRWR